MLWKSASLSLPSHWSKGSMQVGVGPHLPQPKRNCIAVKELKLSYHIGDTPLIRMWSPA